MKCLKSSLMTLTASLFCASLAIADEGNVATAPSLDGGFTASIGTYYAKPSSPSHNSGFRSTGPGNNNYELSNNDPDYAWGTQGSIGYIFDDSSNGMEFSYRGLNSSQ